MQKENKTIKSQLVMRIGSDKKATIYLQYFEKFIETFECNSCKRKCLLLKTGYDDILCGHFNEFFDYLELASNQYYQRQDCKAYHLF